jgi:hypothetical protein
MLATVLPPSSGEIRLPDLDPKNAAKRRRLPRPENHREAHRTPA